MANIPDEQRSREQILRYGSPVEVINAMSALNLELRWALQNALSRIAVLEEAVNHMHRYEQSRGAR